MTAVFAILILLIAAAPVLAIMGGILLAGSLFVMAALAIALIVLNSPKGEFSRLGALWRPIAPIALIPFICLLAQLTPVPGWLAHSAWTSASTALGQPLTGVVTLDIGATVMALSWYSLVVAIAIVSTAVALDRQRAEAVLFLLTVAAVAIAAGLIWMDFGALRIEGRSAQRPQMLTISAIGLVLSCAMTLRTYENYRRRGAESGSTEVSTTIAATASIAAIVICLSAIVINSNPILLLAAASGVLILVGLAVIHRSRLGPWGQSGIAAAAVVALIGFLATIPTNRAVDLTLTWSNEPHASVATTERMLSDAKWTGVGAGTFAALSPVYGDVDNAHLDAAPTAAASIAVEMGRPLLWLLVVVALIGALSFLRRALMRGRQYLYAGTGAACIVAVLVSSFANAGIIGLGAALLTSAVCGLALAQSKGWSV